MNEEQPTQKNEGTEQKVVERIVIDVVRNADPVVRKPYVVTSDKGLLKNGQVYPQGTNVELDAKTAQAFIELGEVEEA